MPKQITATNLATLIQENNATDLIKKLDMYDSDCISSLLNRSIYGKTILQQLLQIKCKCLPEILARLDKNAINEASLHSDFCGKNAFSYLFNNQSEKNIHSFLDIVNNATLHMALEDSFFSSLARHQCNTIINEVIDKIDPNIFNYLMATNRLSIFLRVIANGNKNIMAFIAITKPIAITNLQRVLPKDNYEAYPFDKKNPHWLIVKILEVHIFMYSTDTDIYFKHWHAMQEMLTAGVINREIVALSLNPFKPRFLHSNQYHANLVNILAHEDKKIKENMLAYSNYLEYKLSSEHVIHKERQFAIRLLSPGPLPEVNPPTAVINNLSHAIQLLQRSQQSHIIEQTKQHYECAKKYANYNQEIKTKVEIYEELTHSSDEITAAKDRHAMSYPR